MTVEVGPKKYSENARVDKSRWHFQRRLWENYGIILGQDDYKKIIREIQEGKALLKERTDAHGNSNYYVSFLEGGVTKLVEVAYSSQRRSLISAFKLSTTKSRREHHDSQPHRKRKRS